MTWTRWVRGVNDGVGTTFEVREHRRVTNSRRARTPARAVNPITRRELVKKSLSALCVAVGVLAASTAYAQVNVTLPNSSQTTTLTATVTEQADVVVPAGVTFNVNDIDSATAASGVGVSASSVVLSSATKALKISLQANAATFTQPTGSVTWNASDVSWNAATWSNATGASGSLSNSAFNAVATCAAGAASCETSDLVFTLAPNSNIVRSGNYTIVVTWKFESI